MVPAYRNLVVHNNLRCLLILTETAVTGKVLKDSELRVFSQGVVQLERQSEVSLLIRLDVDVIHSPAAEVSIIDRIEYLKEMNKL